MRKYQKIFFIVITSIIVVSFSFFGVMRKLPSSQALERDEIIGVSIDGKKIRSKPIHEMVRFLATDRFDAPFLQHEMANFFNDGVIKRDILEMGLGDLLVKTYFEEIKEELQPKMQKFQTFRCYEHPSVPYISVEGLYAQAVPRLVEHLDVFRSLEDLEKEGFSYLAKIYVDHSRIQPEMVRQILEYQQNQLGPHQMDPYLETGDLTLFHAHSLHDWFGKKFIELACQFIYNSALYAEKMGYKVTLAEAQTELMQNGYQALSEALRKEISNEEWVNYYSRMLAGLGMQEKEAAEVWQKVMLFRRLFQDVSKGVLVDQSTMKDYFSYIHETLQVDLYQLPKELFFKDFWSMLQFEMYLDSIGKKEGLLLPSETFSIAEIEQKTPELVEQRYLIELAEINLTEVAERISLKEMWNWQTHLSNWEKIKKQFLEVSSIEGSNQDERLEQLDKLPSKLRGKIDEFSRIEMARSKLDWIEEGLQKKEAKSMVLSIPSKGKIALKGAKNAKTLIGMLDKSIEEDQVLENITFDQNTFYRIHVLKRKQDKELLTFVEAKEQGVLDQLLERKLQSSYEQTRVKHAADFAKEDGTYRPFSEVKELVGKWAYQDLLRKIEASVKGTTTLKEPLVFYAKYRLQPWMQKMKEQAEKQPELVILQKTEGKEFDDKLAVSEQWKILKVSKEVSRKNAPNWLSDQDFASPEQSWSAVFDGDMGLSFFQILSHQTLKSKTFEKELQGTSQLLINEARQEFAKDLIEQIREKNAICLTKKNVEEDA